MSVATFPAADMEASRPPMPAENARIGFDLSPDAAAGYTMSLYSEEM